MPPPLHCRALTAAELKNKLHGKRFSPGIVEVVVNKFQSRYIVNFLTIFMQEANQHSGIKSKHSLDSGLLIRSCYLLFLFFCFFFFWGRGTGSCTAIFYKYETDSRQHYKKMISDELANMLEIKF